MGRMFPGYTGKRPLVQTSIIYSKRVWLDIWNRDCRADKDTCDAQVTTRVLTQRDARLPKSKTIPTNSRYLLSNYLSQHGLHCFSFLDLGVGWVCGKWEVQVCECVKSVYMGWRWTLAAEGTAQSAKQTHCASENHKCTALCRVSQITSMWQSSAVAIGQILEIMSSHFIAAACLFDACGGRQSWCSISSLSSVTSCHWAHPRGGVLQPLYLSHWFTLMGIRVHIWRWFPWVTPTLLE